YFVKHFQNDAVGEHQLVFLAENLQTNQTAARQQLEAFGKQLKGMLQQESFHWKGIGKLELSGTSILFHPGVIVIDGLQPVAANKVARENVRHTVLKEEREEQPEQAQLLPTKEKKRSCMVVLAGILLLLFLAFIVFYY